MWRETAAQQVCRAGSLIPSLLPPPQLLAKHVLHVHLNALQTQEEDTVEGELSLPLLKKYIAFCRRYVGEDPNPTLHMYYLNHIQAKVCVFSSLPSSFSLYSSTLLPPCSKCGPRLSAQSAEKLANRYVSMRTVTRQHEKESSQRISIPITVRFAAVVNS